MLKLHVRSPLQRLLYYQSKESAGPPYIHMFHLRLLITYHAFRGSFWQYGIVMNIGACTLQESYLGREAFDTVMVPELHSQGTPSSYY